MCRGGKEKGDKEGKEERRGIWRVEKGRKEEGERKIKVKDSIGGERANWAREEVGKEIRRVGKKDRKCKGKREHKWLGNGKQDR